MAKKIDGMDKINDTTLHELLVMMDARLKHIEDISADNRAIIVKLVKFEVIADNPDKEKVVDT